MTKPNKKGRSPKMARLIAQRKLKARLQRQKEEKYAARTGRSTSS